MKIRIRQKSYLIFVRIAQNPFTKLFRNGLTSSKKKGKRSDQMNELQIFNYNGNEVRTVQIDGEPW